MKRRQIKTAVKIIIRTAVGKPLQLSIFATFALMRRLPEGFLSERFFQFIAYASRSLPERRTTPWFIQYSLALRDRRFSFKFRSREVDLFWTATAFPDLLTRHMLFEGVFQEDVLLALRSHIGRGDVVIDAGGHHGLMAIVSARAAGDNGRVITFEPNPYARKHLETHLRINGVTNVDVDPRALSDAEEELTFYIQTGDVSWNSTIVKEFAARSGFEREVKVVTTTIDKYVMEAGVRPKVIKIDVEGAEFFVLQGATRTIREFKPVLILEFNPLSAQAAGRSIGEYVTFLSEESYDLTVLRSNIFGRYRRALEAFDERKHATAASSDAAAQLANVICVPNRS